MRGGGIYTITTPSGHQYVGSAVSFVRRWNRHKCDLEKGVHSNVKLQRAFAKYGIEGLRFEVLMLCGRDELLDLEQLAIDTLEPAYNISLVAGSRIGVKHTDAAKAKMAAATKALWKKGVLVGVKPNAETRAKMSAAHFGRKVSEETRARMSAALRERWGNIEERSLTAEHRARISIACKAVTTAEHRARISIARKAATTAETRIKNSLATKAAWERGAYDNRNQ